MNCATCNGTGVVVVRDADGKEHAKTCPACGGSGRASDTRDNGR